MPQGGGRAAAKRRRPCWHGTSTPPFMLLAQVCPAFSRNRRLHWATGYAGRLTTWAGRTCGRQAAATAFLLLLQQDCSTIHNDDQCSLPFFPVLFPVPCP